MRQVLAAIFIFVMLIQAGCGKKEEENVIRFSMSAFPAHDKKREEFARKFEAIHPEIKVKYEPISGDYYTKLITMIGGGTQPDIFVVGDYHLYASNGILLDITPYLESESDKEWFTSIYPQLRKDLEIDGKIYGILDNLNVKVLFYNKDLFDEAGVEYPNDSWAWDDMVEVAEKLTIRTKKGKVKQYGLSIPYNEWHIFIHQNGGRIWSEDGTECVINSPEAQEAMEFLYDICEKRKLSPSLLDPNKRVHQATFLAGRSAMYIAPRWVTSMFKRITDFEWSVAMLPKKKIRWTECAGLPLGISSKTKNPQMAYEFLKFLVSPEVIKEMVLFGDSIPICRGEKYNDYFINDPDRPKGEGEVYLRSMEFAGTMSEYLSPYVPRVEQETIMREEIDRFLLGQVPVEHALSKIQTSLNEIAKRNRP